MKYKGIIWTNHLLNRMKQRDIEKDYVYWTFAKPDRQERGNTPGAYKFLRSDGKQWFVVIAKKNDQGVWVLMSCWTKPKFSRHRPVKGLSFWQNLIKMIFG